MGGDIGGGDTGGGETGGGDTGVGLGRPRRDGRRRVARPPLPLATLGKLREELRRAEPAQVYFILFLFQWGGRNCRERYLRVSGFVSSRRVAVAGVGAGAAESGTCVLLLGRGLALRGRNWRSRYLRWRVLRARLLTHIEATNI